MNFLDKIKVIRLIPLCFLLAIAVLFPSEAFGQAVATLENNELLMGKTLKLTLSVPIPNDTVQVQFPMLQMAEMEKKKYVPLLNDTIELLTAHNKSKGVKDGKTWVNYDMKIQAFDSGRYELPPFEFIVGKEKVTSNRLTVNVLPVKVKADEKIDAFSDIAEPFDINPDPEALEEESSILWWLIGAAVLLLALIAFLYLRYRKTGSILLLSKPVPPYAQALNKLRKLQQQNLPQKGKTKEYYTRLTDILRSYLNRQFGIKTFEKTSNEILWQVGLDEDLKRYEGILKSIFETADFVKFAKVNPSVVENGRCMTDAERFVEASHPIEDKTLRKGGEK